ncbi:26728_t:CDS:2 [Gigaspora margarita]|uniref:26728_t:CDS:1 n=1 Tax=Gigaspora margarita TaxID=4874 RepID=A0ABN7W2I0_GIGMA|nr:26728_t:CDS:2 [Gigaspora margarita]
MTEITGKRPFDNYKYLVKQVFSLLVKYRFLEITGPSGKANLLVAKIKAELDGPPLLNITKLNSKFHNYENLTLSELEAIKNDLIAAIKN